MAYIAQNPVVIFYGACVFGMLALSLLSRREALIKLGLILLAAYVACNLAMAANGKAHAPMLIPTIDAILALLTAGIVALDHSKTAAVVFALFVLVEIVHVAAFQTRTQGSHTYFLYLNLIFLAQVVAVGSSGASVLIVRLADPPRMAGRVSRGWLRHGPHSGRG